MVVNVILAGKVPKDFAPWIAGARLIGLVNPSNDLRPIAIGEIWRRLASKVALLKVTTDAASFLSPLQMGVGVSCGVEAIIHSVRSVTEAKGSDPSLLLFKADFKNVFNLTNRTEIFRSVASKFPQLSKYVEFCYGAKGKLQFGEHYLSSSIGVQQGDPLAPLLFSLVLHPLATRIKAECPDLIFNAWYLDDGTFIGPRASILKVIDILKTYGPPLGLVLNLGKSEIWWPSMEPELTSETFPELQMVLDTGIIVLGSFVGNSVYCNRSFEKAVEEVKGSLLSLKNLDDAQIEFTLLRVCLGFPKINYLLRTLPSSLVIQGIGKFDSYMDEALVNVLAGYPLDLAKRQLASLPPKLGGLGIPQAASLCNAIFVASASQSLPMRLLVPDASEFSLPSQDFVPLLASLNDQCKPDVPITLTLLQSHPKPQKWCVSLVHAVTKKNLLLTSSLTDSARILSCSMYASGFWLTAPPIQSLGYVLGSRAFRRLLRLRLGLPIGVIPRNGNCSRCKNANIDAYGNHAISCYGLYGLHYRHTNVAKSIHHYLKKCGFNSVLEATGLMRDSRERPGDVLVNGLGAQPCHRCFPSHFICSANFQSHHGCCCQECRTGKGS